MQYINTAGIELVKHFESYQRWSNWDNDHYVIGYGHTGLIHNDGTVYKGRQVTKAEALRLLMYDMTQAAYVINKAVTVPLNDNQIAALISFEFNTGGISRGERDCTPLRLINAGDCFSGFDALLAWCKDEGKLVEGLFRRRKSERNLACSFIKPIIYGDLNNDEWVAEYNEIRRRYY